MRYTEKDARRAFELLAKALGKSTEAATKQPGGGYKSNVGAWILDYNALYGGCEVREINNEGGGVSQPLHTDRMSPREFCKAVNFALGAIYVLREGK